MENFSSQGCQINKSPLSLEFLKVNVLNFLIECLCFKNGRAALPKIYFSPRFGCNLCETKKTDA